jgi:hypothetical protein
LFKINRLKEAIRKASKLEGDTLYDSISWALLGMTQSATWDEQEIDFDRHVDQVERQEIPAPLISRSYRFGKSLRGKRTISSC